ncbi:Lrp/AsnC family transcriptional regulator [Hydrogenimonas urashimensis]|uniref:siroheme decarboxylase subunit alpha n=1 Tax=Hydrogenimonas urashimensis TaxID=2740515 RepID=UPI001914FC4D|nr:Lrp/AsnC family transcriptional regulator [Hydrogenimonas urashimensis]
MEKEFLTLIQKNFPIARRPFAELAETLGSSEKEVLDLYRALKEQKVIRQTSAIFDTKSLGYKSSLVAFKVENIEKAAAIINAHPGVSHNYERDNPYNLWFTIAVAPDSKLGLEKTVEILAEKSEAESFIVLPTKKMFKISVQLDVKGDRAKKEKLKRAKKEPMVLEPVHYEMIKGLQKDIEPMKEPFKALVEALGIDYETLASEAERMKKAGLMRRFAAILYHRKAGFTANAMVVWKVPEERAEAIGETVAAYSAVSHCYLRPVYPEWPYPLFSMVHGKSKEEVESIVEEMAGEIGIKEYNYLYSTREFKKVRIEYFSPEFEKWEKRVVGR